MTNQEINEAVARKLGYAVTVGELTGKESHKYNYSYGYGVKLETDPNAKLRIPNYVANISAAFEIVDYLAKENERKGGGPILVLCHDGLWHFRIGEPPIGKLYDKNVAQADTAPMAICKAFLKLEETK